MALSKKKLWEAMTLPPDFRKSCATCKYVNGGICTEPRGEKCFVVGKPYSLWEWNRVK